MEFEDTATRIAHLELLAAALPKPGRVLGVADEHDEPPSKKSESCSRGSGSGFRDLAGRRWAIVTWRWMDGVRHIPPKPRRAKAIAAMDDASRAQVARHSPSANPAGPKPDTRRLN